MRARLDADGRLIDTAGAAVPGIFCIGSIRQGEEWETTAIPEIRSQAAAVATLLALGTKLSSNFSAAMTAIKVATEDQLLADLAAATGLAF